KSVESHKYQGFAKNRDDKKYLPHPPRNEGQVCKKTPLNSKSLFDKALCQCLNSAATKIVPPKKQKSNTEILRERKTGVGLHPSLSTTTGQLSAKDKRVNETPLTIGIDRGTTYPMLIYTIFLYG
ncbi:MAG: hypothetical protein ABL925_06235, partial [Methylococcales bacterium]